MKARGFEKEFQALTGNPPFPWQTRLYDECFSRGEVPPSCSLPTGLGKTSVIAVWLIALAHGKRVPRRLVYVVNRRTVVDQTTDEVKKYRENLDKPELRDMRQRLSGLCAMSLDDESPLAVSTLRGQFADNREWSTDPARPAVICGTVDMIGSRLLFSGYGVGMKARPLHAGFLGQDALVVHDEAHLEPAFQTLLKKLCDEQYRCQEFRPFRVMELTATSRGLGDPFALKESDFENKIVRQRIHAPKKLHLEPAKEAKKLAEQIAERALQFKESGLAVLVFVRTVEDVLKVRERLSKHHVEVLTGTMRGKERDDLVKSKIFQRFLPDPPLDDDTVYLVCTSAGEVGVNISADHLVCDLSTFDSMAQRFGRVNRFGNRTDTEIHVVYSTEHKDAGYAERLERTLQLLKQLNGIASPEALGKLPTDECAAAFAPEPTILPVTDILFDAWALTTIRGKLPGRPPVEPYLHGLPTEWQPPETQVAWREEVAKITGDLLDEYEPEELLNEYPLKPQELLREPSDRAFKHLEEMARRLHGQEVPVWLHDDGSVTVLTLAALADSKQKEQINGKTVILPPSAGGLKAGMLDGKTEPLDNGSLDVADEWRIDGVQQRQRLWDDDDDNDKTSGMHEVFAVRRRSDDEDEAGELWRWYRSNNEGDRASKKAVEWCVHVGDVERETAKIVDKLSLPEGLKSAIQLAAKFHDHGKRRNKFQLILGNMDYPQRILAKSGNKRRGVLPEDYRHEFGSLLDIEQALSDAEVSAVKAGEHWDLVLHLIAAHHGRARPHFPHDEVFDWEHDPATANRLAAEVPRRFARLQRKYGRWGLAYLESLLRAADWAASAKPSKFEEEQP